MHIESDTSSSNCRFCDSPLIQSVIDLGMSPLCQKHIKPHEVNEMEKFYPLHALICDQCWLMQLEEFATPAEIFSGDYAYFSSFSDSWLQHAKTYAELVRDRFELDEHSLVVEIASNDGYLLQWFVKMEIPVVGIEPAANVAEEATKRGVRTEVLFFGEITASQIKEKYGPASLLLGNNVLAHVPNINDFVKGMKLLLDDEGVITMEFPHLQRLIEENQFDTIYHEHFSYLSFSAVNRIFAHHGLVLFDVEELRTHGGSLRIYARHAADESKRVSERAISLLNRERKLGMESLSYYQNFQERVKETKRKLLEFLIRVKREGKVVAAYGAPGKGNTLLNYCGIRTDFLDFTVDRSPHKQGNFLPGTHIPIYDPEEIRKRKPDFILILPWNLTGEISQQMSYVHEWGGRFVIPIPEVKVLAPGDLAIEHTQT